MKDRSFVELFNGQLLEVPHVDDELRSLRDEVVFEMFQAAIQRGPSDTVEQYACKMACCRELERRGRIDLLSKALNKKYERE
jgi:hypothetical protein